jgi:hypothetical protein
MECKEVTSIDQAMKEIPFTLFPVQGLRRTSEGDLTEDAIRTIMDGLKSRGKDISDPNVKKEALSDLSAFLCSVNKQYAFILNTIIDMLKSGGDANNDLIQMAQAKNQLMQDILTISRHIQGVPGTDASQFIEGWQNQISNPSAEANRGTDVTLARLKDEQLLLRGGLSKEGFVSGGERDHAIEITRQKNRVVTNYLGIYGFLNLVAVGLLIYISAQPSK